MDSHRIQPDGGHDPSRVVVADGVQTLERLSHRHSADHLLHVPPAEDHRNLGYGFAFDRIGAGGHPHLGVNPPGSCHPGEELVNLAGLGGGHPGGHRRILIAFALLGDGGKRQEKYTGQHGQTQETHLDPLLNVRGVSPAV